MAFFTFSSASTSSRWEPLRCGAAAEQQSGRGTLNLVKSFSVIRLYFFTWRKFQTAETLVSLAVRTAGTNSMGRHRRLERDRQARGLIVLPACERQLPLVR